MAERRWLVVGDHRIHARVAGERHRDGAEVVLVHGLGVSSRYFLPTLHAVAVTHRVRAVDLPGFGRSSSPDEVLDVVGLAGALGRWLEAAGIQRPLLVGNSLGCQIVAEFAADGHDVAGAVLVGPTVDAAARSRLGQATRWLVNATREPPSMAAVLVRDYLDCGLHRPRRTFVLALEHAIEDRLPDIQAPVVVLRGERDPIASRAWCQRLAACAPDGSFVEVPGAAHTANYSHPQAVAAAVRALAG